MLTATAPTSLSREAAARLIRSAGQAPSPDNNQPWMFRVDRDAISVFHRRERALPSDVLDMFSWIAVGAAIENIVLSATAEGLASEVEYVPRPFPLSRAGEHVATVHFSRGCEPDPLQAWIEKRVTNRRLYDRTPVAPEILGVLGDAISNPEDSLLWLTQPRELKDLARLVSVSDRVRFEHQPFHDEFHQVLRYGHEEARRTGDGLDLRTLEISRVFWPIIRWLRPWKRMRLLNRVGLSRLFADYSRKQVRRCAAAGLLATRDASDTGYLAAGRSLQRVWLAAAQHGLALQPMGSLPLFLTKLATRGEHVPPHVLKRLRGARQEFERLFPQVRDRSPVMLFRIGRAQAPSARSLRYSPEEIQHGET